MTDTRPSLETFELTELAQFTREGAFATDASADFHLFYVGRDNVHEILKYLWSRVTVSAYLNMFGYDDEELNDLVMGAAEDPHTTAVYTLEGSTNWSASGEGTFVLGTQAGGPGYKAQNNTLAVFTDPDTLSRFTAELIAEHLVVVNYGGSLSATEPSAVAPSAAAAT